VRIQAGFQYLLGVDSTRQIRNLTLIGFMGTGKSTVGRLVADILHFTFLDTDDVIEARAGATIQEISNTTASQLSANGSTGSSRN